MPSARTIRLRPVRFAAIPLGLFLALAACSRHDPDAELRARVAELRNRTIPESSKLLQKSDLKRGDWSVEARWEFETDWELNRYSEWVESQLSPEFSRLERNKSQLIFLHQLENDTESLSMDVLPGSDSARIVVRFRAYPK